jgi:dTDP-4-amino-4,6-dideoxygalactose transaminase
MEIFSSTGKFPKANKIAVNGLSLPLNPFLLDQEQDYIIEQISSFFKK